MNTILVIILFGFILFHLNAGELNIKMSQQPEKGDLVFLLFNSPNTFADLRDPAIRKVFSVNDLATYTIKKINPGNYALVIFYDENKNGLIDKNFIGIPKEKIFLVGNVMIDTLLKNKAKAEESNILNQLNLNEQGFCVLTLHRPSNVDDPYVFGRILDALEVIQND